MMFPRVRGDEAYVATGVWVVVAVGVLFVVKSVTALASGWRLLIAFAVGAAVANAVVWWRAAKRKRDNGVTDERDGA
jgi:membrane protein implicated in regulation of membrane protease activity